MYYKLFNIEASRITTPDVNNCTSNRWKLVESSWNVMAHGDAREGKWSGIWRMEWVASTLHTTDHLLHTTSERGVSSLINTDHLLPLMRTSRLQVVDWTDAPTDVNGLVRFVERRNLVSARVSSHFTSSGARSSIVDVKNVEASSSSGMSVCVCVLLLLLLRNILTFCMCVCCC
jgi:hypothetical protein